MTPPIANYETLLSGLISELVAASLEYSGSAANDIFIYAANEGALFFDPFFAVGAEILNRLQVPGVDASPDRQRALVRYGSNQLLQFVQKCAAQGHLPPTEIKIHYVVGTGKTEAEMLYEPQWSNTDDLLFTDRSAEWRAEIRSKLNSGSE